MAKKLLWLCLVLGIGAHFWVGIKQPMFGDEANTILMTKSYNYQYLLTHQIEKIHPNGSLLITKILWDMGLRISGIRLFNWIMFVFTLYPVYQIFKSLQLSKTQALVGLIIWSLAPYILLQSYLVRPYAFGILFLVYSLYFVLTKRMWMSVLFDLLGISFVSGYWIFIVAKYLSMGKQLKFKFLSIIGAALGVNIFTAMNVERAISTHLDWMPTVKFPDLMSMFTTLLGLTSPAYYEGYASTPSSIFLTAALSFSVVILVFLFVRQKSKKSDTEIYVIRLSLITLFCYLLIWTISFVLHLPLFHVRQLFPVAAIFTLTLTYIALKTFTANKVLVLLLVLPFLFFTLRRTLTYTLHPIYPEHMTIQP